MAGDYQPDGESMMSVFNGKISKETNLSFENGEETKARNIPDFHWVLERVIGNWSWMSIKTNTSYII